MARNGRADCLHSRPLSGEDRPRSPVKRRRPASICERVMAFFNPPFEFVAVNLRREPKGYRANVELRPKHFYSKNRGPDTRVELRAMPPEMFACAAPVFRQLG